MKSLSRLFLAAFGCLLLAQAASAQDWPQWRGPDRDNKVVGFTIPKEWPKELTKKWSVNIGLGEASPALVGDKLFVFGRIGEEEVVQCLQASDGTMVWQDKSAAPGFSGGDRQHLGPRSSPTVAEGKVCTLGVLGVLTCYDAKDGKIVWRKESKEFARPFPQFHTAMSPIVADGLCIAHLGGQGAGAIIAYDLNTGAEKWKWSGEGPSYSSPVVATIDGVKQLVALGEKTLVGIAFADGKLLWQMAVGGGQRSQNMATPIVEGNTVYSIGANSLIAVKVEKKADAFAVSDLWSKTTPNSRYTTPVLKEGLLFGANSTGAFFCLKADSGDQAWVDPTRRGDPSFILDAGTVLFTLGNAGDLVVVEPSGEAYKEVAKYKVATTPVWSVPIFSGNRIFIKDRDNLTLWTVP